MKETPVRPALDGPGPGQAGMLAYVRATACLLNIPLDDARADRVAGHLALSAALARALDAHPLPPDVEPAELYCPAPFPAGPGQRWP